MTIFGTRPEVIKLAPIIYRLQSSPSFEAVLVTTGQHREMLDQALDQFGIIPDHDLGIMMPDQAIGDVTATALHGIEDIIKDEKPDLVLVQGDTTTAFTGCLAAFYQQTAIGHVEAGLRTYDKYKPFPEEINRSLITHLSDLHFVPTLSAWDAIRREGITEEKVFITGNTVIDSLFHVIRDDYSFCARELNAVGMSGKRVIVVTSHRRENLGEPLYNICHSIASLVDSFDDIEVVFSVHRNPNVNGPVHEMLDHYERIHLVDPLSYADIANLMSRSYFVMTDSGGLQEEAPALAKPVLVLREKTERPEAVQSGLAKIVGWSQRAIFAAASELLTDESAYASMAQGISPYGDGEAAIRTIEAIEYVNGMRKDRPQPFLSGLTETVTGDQTSLGPISDELFYEQLDKRVSVAARDHQKVSVVTVNLEDKNKEQFTETVRMITRGLRKSDTAAVLSGKHLVVVLPGTTGAQARKIANRLMGSVERSSNHRRATDSYTNEPDEPNGEMLKQPRVVIKTYTDSEASADEGKKTRDERKIRTRLVA